MFHQLKVPFTDPKVREAFALAREIGEQIAAQHRIGQTRRQRRIGVLAALELGERQGEQRIDDGRVVLGMAIGHRRDVDDDEALGHVGRRQRQGHRHLAAHRMAEHRCFAGEPMRA